MDHVGRLHLELDVTVERHHELVRHDAALVLEPPGELLREHLHLERVAARIGVLREDDRADDADRDDEDRRDDRPGELEPGVPVDRRPVGLVVGLHAERPDGVDDHAGDEREDPDADDRREPVGEDDPVHLLGSRVREPRDEDGDECRDERRERGDHDHLEHGAAPDHRRDDTSAAETGGRGTTGPPPLSLTVLGPLAQLVEQGTLNPKVEGSIPSRPIPASASMPTSAHRCWGCLCHGCCVCAPRACTGACTLQAFEPVSDVAPCRCSRCAFRTLRCMLR